MKLPSKAWWIDAAERVGVTAVVAFVGALSITDTTALQLSNLHAAEIAGAAAGLSALKAIVAGFIPGTVSPASLLKKPRGKHRAQDVHITVDKGASLKWDAETVKQLVRELNAEMNKAKVKVRPRKAGHRGRQPVKAPADRFPINWLHSYLLNPLPPVAYPIDVSGNVPDWGMLGNGPDPTCTTHPNGVGDCTFAGREHNKRAKAAAANLTEVWESSDALVAEYLAYDHGKDEGANIADLLLAWYKAGKIEAFAPVDYTNPAAVDSAMAAFHGVYVGVALTDDADQRFESGQPWTVADGQKPDENDGHCIVKVKADGKTDTWVTWGALQPSTVGWTKACLDEAWVIITSEDEHLVDIAALKADINALHGTGGDTPTPEPTPAPAAVDAADKALAPDLKRLLGLKSCPTYIVAPATAWLKDKAL